MNLQHELMSADVVHNVDVSPQMEKSSPTVDRDHCLLVYYRQYYGLIFFTDPPSSMMSAG